MQNYIKCYLAKRQEILTGFSPTTKGNFIRLNNFCVKIVKFEKHIHQFNFPTSFYSFTHSLILYEATERRISKTTLKHKTFRQFDIS